MTLDPTAYHLFVRAADRAPQAAAVREGNTVRTYAEVRRAVERRAATMGDLRGARVGVRGSRAPESVVNTLAVLSRGAAVVPLDAAYPPDRLAQMTDAAGVSLVLDGDGTHQVGTAGDREPGLAYVVFTSGSTGRPKGIRFRDEALQNMIRWQSADSVAGPGDRTAHQAPLSFDVAFQELFATFATGGELVLVPEEAKSDPDRWWQLLVDQSVSRIFLPYVALQLLALYPPPARVLRAAVLREVISAGEQLRCTAEIRELFGRLGNARLTNQYGPSETHVAARHHLPADPTTWPDVAPIGTAAADAVLAVDTGGGTPAPPAAGDRGELWIGGTPVAAGYLGGVSGGFRRDPSGNRWYRTGDRVSVGDDGTLTCLGRVDDQVKVRGYRIEPAEIDVALLRVPGVDDAATVVAGADAMSRVLVAFFVGTARPEDVKRQLALQLPDHMLPATIHRLDALPLTGSGKVDRHRLARAALPASSPSADGPAATTGGGGR